MTQSMKKATRSLDKQPQKQQQQQQRAYMEYKTIPFCRHHFIFCVYTSYTPTNYLTLYLALTFSIFYATIHLVLLTMAIALDEWVHTYIYMCVCLCAAAAAAVCSLCPIAAAWVRMFSLVFTVCNYIVSKIEFVFAFVWVCMYVYELIPASLSLSASRMKYTYMCMCMCMCACF